MIKPIITLDSGHLNLSLLNLFSVSDLVVMRRSFQMSSPELVLSDAELNINQLSLFFFPLSCQVLVLGNKRDLPNALDEKQLIEKM